MNSPTFEHQRDRARLAGAGPTGVGRRSFLARYAVAVGAAAGGILARLALGPVRGVAFPFVMLCAATMVSAWLAGLGPGTVTTLLSAAAFEYSWLEPRGSWAVANPDDLLGFVVFVAVGGLITALNEAWRRGAAHANAERAADQLRQLHESERAARREAERATEQLRIALEAGRMGTWEYTIQRNAQAQARLVESLLGLSRIMAGKLELNLEPLDLYAIVEAALDVIRPDAEAKGITLDVRAPSEAITLVADSGQLQQVFWNLLSNAIKFTPRGGTIGVSLTAQDARRAMASCLGKALSCGLAASTVTSRGLCLPLVRSRSANILAFMHDSVFAAILRYA